MNRLSETKVILVVRPTRLAELLTRFATRMQAEFYVTRLGGDFQDYENEDAVYQTAIRESRKILSGLGRLQIVQRALIPNFVFGPDDIVVTLGQDGLVANTLKYLHGQPLVGVNPDPQRWDGRLLPFKVAELDRVIRDVLRQRRPIKPVTMAQVELNTGGCLVAVNDFFVGARTHASARYRIQHRRQTETHSSSGVIISTGLGSTGWLKSLLTGATAVTQSAAGILPGSADRRPARVTLNSEFPWDAEHLFFTVREPFPSRTTSATMVFGQVTVEQPLILESLMGEQGVIFSDGIEQDYLEFNCGTRAKVTLAERRGALVQ
jgi:NAD kinase